MITSARTKQRIVEEKRRWKSDHSRSRSGRLAVDDASQRTFDDRLSELPVPEILEMSVLAKIDTTRLYTTQLIPLVCSFGTVREEPDEAVELRKMIRRENHYLKTDATIVFAVRRAGCAACRINAQILADVAREDRVALVGVVKEISDFTALSEFYNEYFGQFPVYKDDNWSIFDSLGGRKVSTWKILKKSAKLGRMYKEKAVRNISFGGDARTMGGVLLFDKRGKLRCTFFERYGEEICLEELRSAISQIRQSASRKSNR